GLAAECAIAGADTGLGCDCEGTTTVSVVAAPIQPTPRPIASAVTAPRPAQRREIVASLAGRMRPPHCSYRRPMERRRERFHVKTLRREAGRGEAASGPPPTPPRAARPCAPRAPARSRARARFPTRATPPRGT